MQSTRRAARRATPIRIGGGCGYWGDSQDAPRQLVVQGGIDYLVLDYLAEVTMSVLVRARERNPDGGFARDFVDLVMKPLLAEIKHRGVRVITNAGGVNVRACAAALAQAAVASNVQLKIGIVEGDDVIARIDELRLAGVREMSTDAPLPQGMISANAYLGAFPIARALDAGADVVITGRCVDSALALGPLIHEFGWQADDYDLLSAGTLAGHIIECGAQATGGNFTDWREVADGWDDMGYPIAECRPDGGFTITKPDGTGGRVSRLTVGEQILYEVADPAAYIVPDVICDWSGVTLTVRAPDQVEVAGAKGLPPTRFYKISSTYADGYRATATTTITGFDAVAKGRAYADALLKRTRRLFTQRGIVDYRDTAVHLIGAQTLWGANADEAGAAAREIVVRIDVRHDDKSALEIFSKETTGVALSMTTGRCPGGASGRPKLTPVVAQFAFLIDKDAVRPLVSVDGKQVPCHDAPSCWTEAKDSRSPPLAQETLTPEPRNEVRLIDLAVARSGDKGDSANIGVIAREADYLPYIRNALTPGRVRSWFSHTVKGDVHRYEMPGINGLNFVLSQSLGGGGTSSLHLDSQAKTYAQQLLWMPVAVSPEIADRLRGTKSA